LRIGLRIYFLGNLDRGRFIDIGDYDFGTRSAKAEAVSPANPMTSAGDDNDFIFKSFDHLNSLIWIPIKVSLDPVRVKQLEMLLRLVRGHELPKISLTLKPIKSC
jgi:hypothetical protein